MPSTALSRFSTASILQAKGVVSVFDDAVTGALCLVHAPYSFSRLEVEFHRFQYQAIEPRSF
jgi:hypothetical protein